MSSTTSASGAKPPLVGAVDGGLAALVAEFAGTAILVFLAVGTAMYSDAAAGIPGIAVLYAIMQFAGGIIGALLLWWVSHTVAARTGGPPVPLDAEPRRRPDASARQSQRAWNSTFLSSGQVRIIWLSL